MNKYFLIGDLHGQAFSIQKFYAEYRNIENFDGTDVIISLGDLGSLYYSDGREKFFKELLSKYPFTYYNVRGNHEQRPSYLMKQYPEDWVEEKEFNNIVYYEKEFPSIKYFRDDGGEYNINGKTVLVLPGAYSIDKYYRINKGYKWFPQEQMNSEERKSIIQNLKKKYDYIFSHTCPYSWEPIIRDLFSSTFVGSTSIDKTTERFLDTVIQLTKYEHYYFGHFHDNRDLKMYNSTLVYHQPLELGKFYSDIS